MGKGHRQLGTEPKTLTPPAPKPKVVKPPTVREGDILLLRGAMSGTTVGVVIRVASGKMGVHRCVDASGKIREVRKPMANGSPIFMTDGYEGKIIIVGHDDEWLRFEKGLDAQRKRFEDPHRRASFDIIRDMKKEG